MRPSTTRHLLNSLGADGRVGARAMGALVTLLQIINASNQPNIEPYKKHFIKNWLEAFFEYEYSTPPIILDLLRAIKTHSKKI